MDPIVLFGHLTACSPRLAPGQRKTKVTSTPEYYYTILVICIDSRASVKTHEDAVLAYGNLTCSVLQGSDPMP